ncbi:transporter [Ruegeria sp. Ofav3-42]|uniref:transporter n=1 Tax=Ruegeria sp. Ofav3-42 TaxID=2917759 RepID=UPI001EF4259C|nr:transporter [Ruegeria sp. Ofav3-42]MCG7522512.1 transporter [Ruegeria sp. Ofav3-42]
MDKLLCKISLLMISTLPASGSAQQATDEEIAKQLANPIANLVSVPFQLNYDSGFGPADGHRTTLNIQPVIPIPLNGNWNLISRTILPVIDQTDIAGNSGSQFGLGDTLQSFFVAPNRNPSDGWVIGLGGAFLLPTATDDLLGADKWGAGPSAIAIRQFGPWTVGGLANHVWSFAGDDDRPDVNQSFVQPFVSYTTPQAWQFSFTSESTYNWEAEQWSVPLNFVAGKTLQISGQTVSISGGIRYWAETPSSGPDGLGFRLVTTLVFPK